MVGLILTWYQPRFPSHLLLSIRQSASPVTIVRLRPCRPSARPAPTAAATSVGLWAPASLTLPTCRHSAAPHAASRWIRAGCPAGTCAGGRPDSRHSPALPLRLLPARLDGLAPVPHAPRPPAPLSTARARHGLREVRPPARTCVTSRVLLCSASLLCFFSKKKREKEKEKKEMPLPVVEGNHFRLGCGLCSAGDLRSDDHICPVVLAHAVYAVPGLRSGVEKGRSWFQIPSASYFLVFFCSFFPC